VFKCSLVPFESSLYLSGAPGNNNGRRQEQFLSVAKHFLLSKAIENEALAEVKRIGKPIFKCFPGFLALG
jgi:hypothetical protein